MSQKHTVQVIEASLHGKALRKACMVTYHTLRQSRLCVLQRTITQRGENWHTSRAGGACVGQSTSACKRILQYGLTIGIPVPGLVRTIQIELVLLRPDGHPKYCCAG